VLIDIGEVKDIHPRRKTMRLATLLDPSFTRGRLITAGMSADEAAAKGERFTAAAKALVDMGRAPDETAVAVFVPGRIEVFGKHTDYCGGRSLLCTVERGMCFVAVPRTDATIRFNALDLSDVTTMSLDPSLEPTKRHWSNYPMTVARRVARNFATARAGADIAMTSDLPAASGMSSSSAMVVGCFMLLSEINGLDATPEYQQNIHSKEELAAYLGCIENGQTFGGLTGDRGVGTFGGSQDHTAIVCCKPGQLSEYSFCPVKHERDITLPSDMRFIIADSGVVAEKTRDALEKYNAVSDRARQIVTRWNEESGERVTCLRDVIGSPPDEGRLNAAQQMFANDDSLLSRLDQFLTESEKLIPAAVKTIQFGDFALLRQIANESQDRAERQLLNQVPQTIALQRKLLDAGAWAASAFGAGFGGSVWGLFDERSLPGAREALSGMDLIVSRLGCPATVLTD